MGFLPSTLYWNWLSRYFLFLFLLPPKVLQVPTVPSPELGQHCGLEQAVVLRPSHGLTLAEEGQAEGAVTCRMAPSCTCTFMHMPHASEHHELLLES